jgi:hypothetical protein
MPPLVRTTQDVDNADHDFFPATDSTFQTTIPTITLKISGTTAISPSVPNKTHRLGPLADGQIDPMTEGPHLNANTTPGMTDASAANRLSTTFIKSRAFHDNRVHEN